MDQRPSPLRPIAEGLIVAAGGFVLMNLAFVAFFLFGSAVDRLAADGRAVGGAVRAGELVVFLTALWAGMFAMLRTGIPLVVKAALATVPLAGTYAALGALLWTRSWLVLSAGVLLFTGVITTLHRRGARWQYWWAVIFVSVVMLAITVTGTDI